MNSPLNSETASSIRLSHNCYNTVNGFASRRATAVSSVKTQVVEEGAEPPGSTIARIEGGPHHVHQDREPLTPVPETQQDRGQARGHRRIYRSKDKSSLALKVGGATKRANKTMIMMIIMIGKMPVSKARKNTSSRAPRPNAIRAVTKTLTPYSHPQ